jgi:hypothetical protein
MPLREEDIRLAFDTAVPVDDVDQMMIAHNKWLAVVWLNLSDRPDLAHLAERHLQESGYAVCTWFFANPGKRNMHVGLYVEMRQPTRTAFSVVFKVSKYLDQLSTIAQDGLFWIMPGPPPAHLTGMQVMSAQDIINKIVAHSGNGLHIELEPHLIEELRNQLTGWKKG